MQAAFPEFTPTYAFLNRELDILASELHELATQTDQQITLEEAETAHLHLNSILRHYVLATRAAGFRSAADLPSTPPPTSTCPPPSTPTSR